MSDVIELEKYYVFSAVTDEFLRSFPSLTHAEAWASTHEVTTLDECVILNEREADAFYENKLGELIGG